MARSTPLKDPNSAYRQRASKRYRTIGQDVLQSLGEAQVQALMDDRRRTKRKQFRYKDLQGEDRTNMLRMVRDIAMAGGTDFEISEAFGVSQTTLTTWVAKDPEFAIAMRLPRELADDRVEKALYHRAVGYSFREEQIKIHENGNVTRVPVVKHIPPDPGAATFWLKNRRGHLWKERQEVGLDGAVDVNVKAEDPRALAMAVLDVIQQGIYTRLGPTIEHEDVAEPADQEYIPEELQAALDGMTEEERDAFFDQAGRED